MNCRVASLLCVVSVTATGCFIPDGAAPSVGIGSVVASKFVHRGMVNVDRPVFQPSLSMSLPTKIEGDSVSITTRGNMDLQNDNGKAWFPNGHAGRFSEIDFIGTYSHQLTESINIRGGLFSYNLPNGQEFPKNRDGSGPGEERGGTTEVFVVASANVLETTPYLSWHYDFDEVRSAYYRLGITESFEINDQWNVVVDGSLGYAASGQADWLYDLDKSGFADLRGFAKVNYLYDNRTTISAGVHGSTLVNSTLRDWSTNIGEIDTDPIWFSLGVNWSF
jgi:hypothetical protein